MKKLLLPLLVLWAFMPFVLNSQTFPTISDGTTEEWYSIYSHRSGNVWKDNGDDAKITVVQFENVDELKWKFQQVENESFKIVSKKGEALKLFANYKANAKGTGKYVSDGAGGYKLAEKDAEGNYKGTHDMEIDAAVRSHFKPAPIAEGAVFVFKQFGTDETGFKFQLYCPEFDTYINMTGDSSKEICVYHVDNDGGNPFSAIKSMKEIYEVLYVNPPKISVGEDYTWYFLDNLRKKLVVTSQGDEQKLKLLSRELIEGEEQDAQLFAFEGADGEYGSVKIKCKAGGYLKLSTEKDSNGADRGIFILASAGDDFSIISNTNTNYGENKWGFVHLEAGNGFNGAPGNDLTTYSVTDDGSVFDIYEPGSNPFDKAPALSSYDIPKWYYVKVVRNKKYMTAAGLGSTLLQADLEEGNEAQLFRLNGTYNSFGFIAKTGDLEVKKAADSNDLVLAEMENGDFFKLALVDGNPNQWQVIHNTTSLAFNDYAGSTVGLYTANQGGNELEFIPYSEGSALAESQIDRTQCCVNGKQVTIEGENIAGVIIYDITGTRLITSSAVSTTYTLPATGCYIVSVTYADSVSENIKIIIQ
ncbi:hypothetical protein D0T49_01505 [Paludibacter sp. 221]|uniref:hypothetical protein n=1 Tax=Paludibacter sp. 221 TaxID=2302939 RepID=UPI0013D57471|nr:hypothetical protein [Paludibacter sp. 221]NDV45726.1 hypothetical protein [Paludibacter sp. 221]